MNLESILSLSPDKAAQLLLGSSLSVTTKEGEVTAGIIVEIEAYFSVNDDASHHARGETAATASMYKGVGTLYVHTQRHHTLVDIVTEEEGVPGALLLRAIEPREGIELMKQRRGVEDVHNLCNGPAKLCKALGITKLHDGKSVFDAKTGIKIIPLKEPLTLEEIDRGERIGISKNRTAPLRFSAKGSPFVSQRPRAQVLR